MINTQTDSATLQALPSERCGPPACPATPAEQVILCLLIGPAPRRHHGPVAPELHQVASLPHHSAPSTHHHNHHPCSRLECPAHHLAACYRWHPFPDRRRLPGAAAAAAAAAASAGHLTHIFCTPVACRPSSAPPAPMPHNQVCSVPHPTPAGPEERPGPAQPGSRRPRCTPPLVVPLDGQLGAGCGQPLCFPGELGVGLPADRMSASQVPAALPPAQWTLTHPRPCISPAKPVQHSGTAGVGENLYLNFGVATCSDAVYMWVAEARYYTGTYSSSTGHWTQIVWKVGLGWAVVGNQSKRACPHSTVRLLLRSAAQAAHPHFPPTTGHNFRRLRPCALPLGHVGRVPLLAAGERAGAVCSQCLSSQLQQSLTLLQHCPHLRHLNRFFDRTV